LFHSRLLLSIQFPVQFSSSRVLDDRIDQYLNPSNCTQQAKQFTTVGGGVRLFILTHTFLEKG